MCDLSYKVQRIKLVDKSVDRARRTVRITDHLGTYDMRTNRNLFDISIIQLVGICI